MTGQRHTYCDERFMSAVVAQSSDRDVIHRYARYAGVAMLLTLVFGALGEPYLPGKILVSGDHERLLNVTQQLGRFAPRFTQEHDGTRAAVHGNVGGEKA